MRQANGRDPMQSVQHARTCADAAKRPAGEVDSWGRGNAILSLVKLTPEQYALAARRLRRLALTHDCTAGVWCRDTVAHLSEEAVLADPDDGVLFALDLREPPPAEPPPPPPPEITTELRHAAEVYLYEHANGGVTGLYGRLAKRLVPDGCDNPVRYLRNLLSRCRTQKWLITNNAGRASVPGPLLEEARLQDALDWREAEWDGC